MVIKNLIIGSLLIGSSLIAEDGRRGINLSLSIGLGNVNTTLDRSTTDHETSGLLTGKIGYGFTDNFIAFIEGSNSAHTISVSGESTDIIQNSIGAGATYYLLSKSSSPYISAYIGDVSHGIESTSMQESSFGSFGNLWKLGAGYEYKQWFFQVDYINAESSRVKSDGVFGSIGYTFHIFR
jgi:hypothetical protein